MLGLEERVYDSDVVTAIRGRVESIPIELGARSRNVSNVFVFVNVNRWW